MTYFWEQFSSNELVLVKLWEKTLDVINNRLFKYDVTPPDISILCQSTLNLDMKELPKEGHLLCALWVFYLLKLRKSCSLVNMKYPTYQQFLQTYSNENDPILKAKDPEELNRLWHTANWMAELFKIIPANKNKGLAILVIPKVVEGWEAKYVTGSGQKEVTIDRVKIFEKEGNIKPVVRGKFKPKKAATKKRKESTTYHKTYKTSMRGLTTITAKSKSASTKKKQLQQQQQQRKQLISSSPSLSKASSNIHSRITKNILDTNTTTTATRRSSAAFDSMGSSSSSSRGSSDSGKSNLSTAGNMSVESNATISSEPDADAYMLQAIPHLTRSSSRGPAAVINQPSLQPPSATTAAALTKVLTKRPYHKHFHDTTTANTVNNTTTIPSSFINTTNATNHHYTGHIPPLYPKHVSHTYHHAHVWDVLLSDDAHSHHECLTDDEDISVSMAEPIDDQPSVNGINGNHHHHHHHHSRSIRKNSRDFSSHLHTGAAGATGVGMNDINSSFGRLLRPLSEVDEIENEVDTNMNSNQHHHNNDYNNNNDNDNNDNDNNDNYRWTITEGEEQQKEERRRGERGGGGGQDDDNDDDVDVCSIISLSTGLDTSHLLIPVEDGYPTVHKEEEEKEEEDEDIANLNNDNASSSSSCSASSSDTRNHLMLAPMSIAPQSIAINSNNTSTSSSSSSVLMATTMTTTPINSSDDDFIEMLSLLRERSTTMNGTTNNNNSNNNSNNNMTSGQEISAADSSTNAFMKAPLLSRTSSCNYENYF